MHEESNTKKGHQDKRDRATHFVMLSYIFLFSVMKSFEISLGGKFKTFPGRYLDREKATSLSRVSLSFCIRELLGLLILHSGVLYFFLQYIIRFDILFPILPVREEVSKELNRKYAYNTISHMETSHKYFRPGET